MPVQIISIIIETKATMTMPLLSVLLAFVVFSFEPSDAVITSRLQVQVSVHFSFSLKSSNRL
jgi:hypothetical protein